MNKIFIIRDLINFPDSEYGGQQVILAPSIEEAYALALAHVTSPYVPIRRDVVPLEKVSYEEWSLEELAKKDSSVLTSFMT